MVWGRNCISRGWAGSFFSGPGLASLLVMMMTMIVLILLTMMMMKRKMMMTGWKDADHPRRSGCPICAPAAILEPETDHGTYRPVYRPASFKIDQMETWLCRNPIFKLIKNYCWIIEYP